MRTSLVASLLALLACSAATTPVPGNTTNDGGSAASCKVPDGTAFMTKFTTVSGDCGTFPDSLIVVGGSGATTCKTISQSKTDCKVSGQNQCTDANTPDTSFTMSYVFEVSSVGDKLSGTMTIVQYKNSAQTCMGSYSLNGARQ